MSALFPSRLAYIFPQSICLYVYTHLYMYIYNIICVCIFMCLHVHICMYAYDSQRTSQEPSSGIKPTFETGSLLAWSLSIRADWLFRAPKTLLSLPPWYWDYNQMPLNKTKLEFWESDSGPLAWKASTSQHGSILSALVFLVLKLYLTRKEYVV